MKKVVILMGTYNGEKYIRAQLDSILNQDYDSWELIIRDDSSTDQTIEIIREYEKNDSRIKMIDSKRNLGQIKNFEELLKVVPEEEYIMFCDQDDVWKKDKIRITMEAMINAESHNPGLPILVYTEKEYVDNDLNPLKTNDEKLKNDMLSILCQNPVYGCTAMINMRLKELLLPFPNYITCHDYWIALIASSNGIIKRVDYKSILYRQHSNNVTGGINNHSFFKKVKNWNKTNDKIKKSLVQNYLYCKSISKSNIIARRYVDLLESPRIIRVFKALKMGYSLNNIISTARSLIVLLQFNRSKISD